MLIEEADGVNFGINDLICMMLQIGMLDCSLQKELGAIIKPYFAGFNEKLEGYEQAHKTTTPSAFGNAVTSSTTPRCGGQQPNQPRNPNRSNPKKGERRT